MKGHKEIKEDVLNLIIWFDLPFVSLFTKIVFSKPEHFGITWKTFKKLNLYYLSPPQHTYTHTHTTYTHTHTHTNRVRLPRDKVEEFVQNFFLIQSPQRILVRPIYGLKFEEILSKISINLGQSLQWHRNLLHWFYWKSGIVHKKKRGNNGTINLLFILLSKMIPFH